jgi:hypothetical protein
MPKRIVYNGIEMVEGWPERIEEAQKLFEYSSGFEKPVGSQSRDAIRLGCPNILQQTFDQLERPIRITPGHRFLMCPAISNAEYLTDRFSPTCVNTCRNVVLC